MRRRGLLGFAALLPVQAAFGQSGDMRLFRTQVLQFFRQKYPDIPVNPGKDDSTIEIEAGTIDLTNIHATVRDLPADKRQAAAMDVVEKLMESLVPLQREKALSWAEAKPLVRPRLMARDHLHTAPDLLHLEFSPRVIVCYVIDGERHVRFVNRAEVERWDLPPPMVHDEAIANLEKLSQDVPIEVKQAKGGGRFAFVDTGDSYDAARLALPRFRARILEELGSPMFVGIPNRDFFLAWSSDNAQFDKLVARVAKDFGEEPYPITDTIFRVDRQGVRPATAQERRRR
jgi:uncharacterized protein YtpQ (UPF0354 family)